MRGRWKGGDYRDAGLEEKTRGLRRKQDRVQGRATVQHMTRWEMQSRFHVPRHSHLRSSPKAPACDMVCAALFRRPIPARPTGAIGMYGLYVCCGWTGVGRG